LESFLVQFPLNCSGAQQPHGLPLHACRVQPVIHFSSFFSLSGSVLICIRFFGDLGGISRKRDFLRRLFSKSISIGFRRYCPLPFVLASPVSFRPLQWCRQFVILELMDVKIRAFSLRPTSLTSDTSSLFVNLHHVVFSACCLFQPKTITNHHGVRHINHHIHRVLPADDEEVGARSSVPNGSVLTTCSGTAAGSAIVAMEKKG